MTRAAHSSRPGLSWANWLWLAAYAVVILGVVFFVLYLRETILRDLDTPEARAEWQAWRDAPPNSDETGPVRRKPPTVTEPPALVLMRDHFAVVMSGSVLFSSLLFAALMMAFRGATAGLASRPADNREP